MKVNTTMKALTVAVASLLSTGAYAVVDLDAGTGTATYASELSYDNAAGIANTAAGILTVDAKLGFGVSGSQTRYVRYDLSNGKFATAVTAAMLTDNTTGANLANVTVSQGGAVGDSFVIFQITAAAGGIPTADVIRFAPGAPAAAVRVPSTGSSVGVTYTLHETAVSAVNGASGNAILSSKAGALAKFSAGLKFAIDSTFTTTADVEQAFKQFIATSGGNTGSATVAELGVITYGVNAVNKADGTAVALTDLVTAATNVVVKGDFGAAGANGVFLSNSGTCATADIAGTLNAAKNQATVVVGTTAQAARSICYNVNGTTAVPAQTTTIGLDLTAAAGSSAADVADATFGAIDRNGTELQSPWFTTFSGYISRFVLTNQHSADAAYTASVITEDGNTCTTGAGVSGTLKQGKQTVIDATAICSAFTTGKATRAAVVFTIAAPNSKIQGVYNVVKADTGSVSVSNMMRPGTN